MLMRSYFIVIHVDPNRAPKMTQVRLHSNAFPLHCISRGNENASKITQMCLHANAFLIISSLLTHACTLLCISELPVHVLSQVLV